MGRIQHRGRVAKKKKRKEQTHMPRLHSDHFPCWFFVVVFKTWLCGHHSLYKVTASHQNLGELCPELGMNLLLGDTWIAFHYCAPLTLPATLSESLSRESAVCVAYIDIIWHNNLEKTQHGRLCCNNSPRAVNFFSLLELSYLIWIYFVSALD